MGCEEGSVLIIDGRETMKATKRTGIAAERPEGVRLCRRRHDVWLF